jgi:hypothetical protein
MKLKKYRRLLSNKLLWYAFLEDCLTLLLVFFSFFMAIELLLPGFISERFSISFLFFLLLCLVGLQVHFRERLNITLSPGHLPRWLHFLAIVVFFGFFIISNLKFGYAGIMLQVVFLIGFLYFLYQPDRRQK